MTEAYRPELPRVDPKEFIRRRKDSRLEDLLTIDQMIGAGFPEYDIAFLGERPAPPRTESLIFRLGRRGGTKTIVLVEDHVPVGEDGFVSGWYFGSFDSVNFKEIPRDDKEGHRKFMHQVKDIYDPKYRISSPVEILERLSPHG
jgi:hypothetical protein